MNKSKLKATIFILVLLVVAAAVTAIATGRSVKPGNSAAQNTTTPSQSQIAPPSETPEATPSESTEPSDSAEPSESPEPSESTEPTPTPSEPVADRTVSGSGSFASDTGTPLNLTVNYTAAAKSASEVSITFDLYLNCYTINATAKPGGATVTFNGKTYTMSTPELSSSSATATSVKLCSKTVTVPLAAGESLNVPVSASWAFGGKYSNVDLATIDASGTLSVQG